MTFKEYRLYKGALVVPLFLMASHAIAQEAARAYPVQVPQSAGGGSFIWLTLVTLILGAALVALVAWYVRKSVKFDASAGLIEILSSQGLGPRERLLIVRVKGRVFMVGHTPSQINLITELDAAAMPDRPVKPVDGAGEFAAKLTDMIRRRVG